MSTITRWFRKKRQRLLLRIWLKLLQLCENLTTRVLKKIWKSQETSEELVKSGLTATWLQTLRQHGKIWEDLQMSLMAAEQSLEDPLLTTTIL